MVCKFKKKKKARLSRKTDILPQIKELSPSHPEKPEETGDQFSIKISPWCRCLEGRQGHVFRMFPVNCHTNLIYQYSTNLACTTRVSSGTLTEICNIPLPAPWNLSLHWVRLLSQKKKKYHSYDMSNEEGRRVIIWSLPSDNTEIRGQHKWLLNSCQPVPLT